jgi:sugar fermentation stimulation protein A
VVQRADCVSVRPAEEIDPAYAAALRQAVAGGVKVAAVGCRLGPDGITVDKLLPVVL